MSACLPCYIALLCTVLFCTALLFTEIYCTTHCKENPIYVFLFWELRGLSPNSHIYVSVSIGPHISLQQNRQTDPGNMNLSQIYNV